MATTKDWRLGFCPVKRGRAFGRFAAVDTRDRKFRYRPKMSEPLQRLRNRRWKDDKWLGDQGRTPECVGYAWSHWLINRPLYQWCNPSGIYAMAQHLDEWEGVDYEGTSVRAGAKLLHRLGFISRYEWAQTAEEVAACLLETGPVVIGSMWREDMFKCDDLGVICYSGAPVGGHAYLLTGICRFSQGGYVRVKNSWGTGWGESGFAWMSLDDISLILQDGGEACVAVEVKPSWRNG